MERGKVKNTKDKFTEIIKRDPHIVAIVMGIITHGIEAITEQGTLIILYSNKKTNITAIIDPAKPTIFIEDKQTNEKLNIPIKLATKITIETFGLPELTGIPKFWTNIPEAQNLFRNFQPTHHTPHPTENHEN
ncbi:MAG: hypothetical protein ACO2PP_18010 [Thermocrinis sp.]|jgi:hypothetical protein|uniref:hypothetical protein n=1 Tax=Thermocrinis sp. TaxID=2024383 RepID=UPI003C064B64